MRLTKAVVESARYPEKGQRFLRDSVDVGLALRVTPGAKTFILERRIDGKVVRGALGHFPDFTLAAARGRARQYKGMIADGKNPFEERVKARRAKQEALTFGDLAQRYVDEYARSHRKSWKRDKDRLERHFGHFDNKKVAEVDASMVNKVLVEVKGSAGPVEANRAVQLLRSVFNKAKELKWYVGENPVPGGRGFFFEEHSRERFLSQEEASRVGRALVEERDWRYKAFCTLDLLLALRKSELLTARWEYVDLNAGILTLPTTKAGRSHRLPLPEAAVAMLTALPSRGQSEWVFPGRGKSGHLADVSSAWTRIRTRAGVPDVTVHDLRRTAGSWITVNYKSLPVVGRVLNHKRSASTEPYARLLLDPIRMALEDHAGLMLGKLGAAEVAHETTDETAATG
jgi:integrase